MRAQPSTVPTTRQIARQGGPCNVRCSASGSNAMTFLAHGDVSEVWQPWAPDRRGHGVPSSHHMAEEAPEALAKAMVQFFA